MSALDPATIRELSVRITDAQLNRAPELVQRYGATGRERCIEDTAYHLAYLSAAVDVGEPALFEDYIRWTKVALTSRGIAEKDLVDNVHEIEHALNDRGLAEVASVAGNVAARIESMPSAIPSCIDPRTRLAGEAAQYLDAILHGRRADADTVISGLVDRGDRLEDLYLEIFEPVQHEIGRLWQINRITVAQEHFCTAAVQRTMSGLYGRLFQGARGRLRVVAACAGPELHEVGLRMVTDLLELNGWDTVYLGANIPPDQVVRTAAEEPTALVAVSVTITPHLAHAMRLIQQLKSNPVTKSIPVIAGGLPFRVSHEVATRIGADAWALNATEAVRRADELVKRGRA